MAFDNTARVLAFGNAKGFRSLATVEAYKTALAVLTANDAKGVPHCTCCSVHERVLKSMIETLACTPAAGEC
jgi:hypothetical protein